MSRKGRGHKKFFSNFGSACFDSIARPFLNIYQIFLRMSGLSMRPFLLILTLGIIIGYGVAFPKNSMWIQKFNAYLMRYRQNGDLERMQRFWFTGACDPREKRRTSSKPLALAQVNSLVCIHLLFMYSVCICRSKYSSVLLHDQFAIHWFVQGVFHPDYQYKSI